MRAVGWFVAALLMALLAPVAEAAETPGEVAFVLDAAGKLEFSTSNVYDGADAVALRRAFDGNGDGVVNAAEAKYRTDLLKSEVSRHLGGDIRLDEKSETRAELNELSYFGVIGAVATGTPITEFWRTTYWFPVNVTNATHALRLEAADDPGSRSIFITVPDGYVITNSTGLTETSSSAGGAALRGRNDGVAEITYRFERDADKDGSPDPIDNCGTDANADQKDSDKDGPGDVCDPDDDNDSLSDSKESGAGTDPLRADSDGDGVKDPDDLFPLDATDSNDEDGDGKGDNSDIMPAIAWIAGPGSLVLPIAGIVVLLAGLGVAVFFVLRKGRKKAE